MKFIYDIWNRLMLKRKDVRVGKDLKIRGRIFIHGKKSGIMIGDNCTVNSDENINPTSGVQHTHLVVGPNGTLIVGNGVGMSCVYITAYDQVIIEDHVLLGSGVKIWDTDFHPICYEDRVFKNLMGVTKAVRIGEGAFIGACSIILKGVTIGKHSVIGAGSVITRDIPANEVWAGNPAVFIKKLGEKV